MGSSFAIEVDELSRLMSLAFLLLVVVLADLLVSTTHLVSTTGLVLTTGLVSTTGFLFKIFAVASFAGLVGGDFVALVPPLLELGRPTFSFFEATLVSVFFSMPDMRDENANRGTAGCTFFSGVGLRGARTGLGDFETGLSTLLKVGRGGAPGAL